MPKLVECRLFQSYLELSIELRQVGHLGYVARITIPERLTGFESWPVWATVEAYQRSHLHGCLQ
jgi:hypothetical protein